MVFSLASLSIFQQIPSPYSSPANITPPCLLNGRKALVYRSRNQALGFISANLDGFLNATSFPSELS
ncbi:hypothetical protein IC582_023917 [Cucumis melo]